MIMQWSRASVGVFDTKAFTYVTSIMAAVCVPGIIGKRLKTEFSSWFLKT